MTGLNDLKARIRLQHSPFDVAGPAVFRALEAPDVSWEEFNRAILEDVARQVEEDPGEFVSVDVLYPVEREEEE